MTVATHGGGSRPFPISNFQGSAFPKLWMRSPTQASGELDKVVGFPIVDPWLRARLKKLPFDPQPSALDDELRADLAEEIWNATLQPVSTFMNSIRERLGPAARTGGGGARIGGSHAQGAVYNPRTLISLLNIFRVHYNFFEPRPYVSLWNADEAVEDARAETKELRYPGTREVIAVMPARKARAVRKTPAMRHGMEAFVRRSNGEKAVPNLYRLIYRPWLYAGTKVGAKLDRTATPPPEPQAPQTVSAGMEMAGA